MARSRPGVKPPMATFSRRNFLKWSGLAAANGALAACGLAATPTPTAAPKPTRTPFPTSTPLPTAKPTQKPTVAAPTQVPPTPTALAAEAGELTPTQSLQLLLEGNQRFMSNRSTDLNESEARRTELTTGQHPFATIFSCVDSRVPPELVFDRGLGDLFVIRSAGQVLDRAVLGSLEFGVAELHIPLLVVMGHEKCGAVKATIEAVEKNLTAEADINWLVENIRPAVEQTPAGGADHLDEVVRTNVRLTVEKLKASPILSEALARNELLIVGARYDLDTGGVDLVA